jgi:hypothetical protein
VKKGSGHLAQTHNIYINESQIYRWYKVNLTQAWEKFSTQNLRPTYYSWKQVMAALEDCSFGYYKEGYGLNYQGIGIWFQAGATDFLRCVQTRSGTHSASYPINSGGLFPQGKADNSPPSSTKVRNTQRYTSTPLYLHCMISHMQWIIKFVNKTLVRLYQGLWISLLLIYLLFLVSLVSVHSAIPFNPHCSHLNTVKLRLTVALLTISFC